MQNINLASHMYTIYVMLHISAVRYIDLFFLYPLIFIFSLKLKKDTHTQIQQILFSYYTDIILMNIHEYRINRKKVFTA